ncbi:MAG TPA: LON peptidase substrate-binding domain-containing protein, partial [Steroidobacteraceae bacterium]|nr:LON peptidase substrate-binding domain-containing protein [Steroidobacteraceae bacterium]
LRIFETRYIDMVRRCMREETGFGVVLIESGTEVGAATRIHGIGTYAEIIDFSRHDDGLLGITATGRRRFRILEARRERDGLNVGTVAWLEEAPDRELPRDYAELADLLRQALPQLGGLYELLERNYGDAGWVGGRLAELLPLPLEDKQRCLELEDPIRRLELLRPMIRIAAPGGGEA